MREEVSNEDLQRAGDLLAGFLADRSEPTRNAYSTDVDDFARFVGVAPSAAAAQLLARGWTPVAA